MSNNSIEIKFTNNQLLVNFTIQFLIINLLNILFGYYILLPMMNKKYNKTFKNLIDGYKHLNLLKNKNNKEEEEDNKKEKKKFEKTNKKYLTSTLTFFLFVSGILIILNLYVLFINPSKYINSLKKQLNFGNIMKSLCFTLFIIIVQLYYFNNFTFSYYMNLVLKYALN